MFVSHKLKNIFSGAMLLLSTFFGTFAYAVELKHWPEEQARQLAQFIEKNANKGQFAVFDMDNTSFRYDLMEALLPYMEQRGILTRKHLDPSLLLVKFKDEKGKKENLFSYYLRLCQIDSRVCYPWLVQAFSGFTLAELKKHVDDLMELKEPIEVTYYEGETIKTSVQIPPKPFAGQQELFKALMDNGIEVYIITAAHEELVRMIASDPKYGYNVKPENVVGAATLLKNRKTGELTTTALQISQGNYNPEKNMSLEVTPYLWSPLTWFEGKAAAITSRIDLWQKPIIAGGDTPDSDGYMLFNSLADDGIKIWVNKKDSDMAELQEKIAQFAREQKKLGQAVTADKNWVIVKPEEIQ